MKVIGIVNASNYDARYLVEVGHLELAAVFKKNYRDELPVLKVGQEMNLAEGQNFRDQIKSAADAMANAHKQFAAATQTMTEFVALLSPKPTEGGQQ